MKQQPNILQILEDGFVEIKSVRQCIKEGIMVKEEVCNLDYWGGVFLRNPTTNQVMWINKVYINLLFGKVLKIDKARTVSLYVRKYNPDYQDMVAVKPLLAWEEDIILRAKILLQKDEQGKLERVAYEHYTYVVIPLYCIKK